MFQRKVHIVPLGYEFERVVIPIERGKADVVVLLNNDGPSNIRADYQDEIEELLQDDAELELDQRGCDIFDMYDALEAITKAISDYSDEDVYLNLATGTKVSAVAGMIACMSTDAEPFYVKPRIKGTAPPDKDELPRFDMIMELPDYPIEKPTDDQIRVMQHVYSEMGESKARKKDLIEFAEDTDLEFAEGADQVSDKALYPRLNSHVIDPLGKKGFIRTEERGNTTRVWLTEEGEKAVKAFQHLV